MELHVKSNRDEIYKITVKLTNETPPNDPTCLHQFNVLLRQCMKDVGMQEVLRSFFDPELAINLTSHK